MPTDLAFGDRFIEREETAKSLGSNPEMIRLQHGKRNVRGADHFRFDPIALASSLTRTSAR
jgi:hypothetical protein